LRTLIKEHWQINKRTSNDLLTIAVRFTSLTKSSAKRWLCLMNYVFLLCSNFFFCRKNQGRSIKTHSNNVCCGSHESLKKMQIFECQKYVACKFVHRKSWSNVAHFIAVSFSFIFLAELFYPDFFVITANPTTVKMFGKSRRMKNESTKSHISLSLQTLTNL